MEEYRALVKGKENEFTDRDEDNNNIEFDDSIKLHGKKEDTTIKVFDSDGSQVKLLERAESSDYVESES